MQVHQKPSSKNSVKTQKQDVIFWGTGAVLAVSLTGVSYFINTETSDFTKEPGNKSSILATIDKIKSGSMGNSKRESDQSKLTHTKASLDFGTTIAVQGSSFDTDGGWAKTGKLDGENTFQHPIGVNLGVGKSFAALSKRYASLMQAAPTLFSSLEPRATIVDVEGGIEAHLIAGPLENIASAHRLCENINLHFKLKCAPAEYKGQTLKMN